MKKSIVVLLAIIEAAFIATADASITGVHTPAHDGDLHNVILVDPGISVQTIQASAEGGGLIFSAEPMNSEVLPLANRIHLYVLGMVGESRFRGALNWHLNERLNVFRMPSTPEHAVEVAAQLVPGTLPLSQAFDSSWFPVGIRTISPLSGGIALEQESLAAIRFQFKEAAYASRIRRIYGSYPDLMCMPGRDCVALRATLGLATPTLIEQAISVRRAVDGLPHVDVAILLDLMDHNVESIEFYYSVPMIEPKRFETAGLSRGLEGLRLSLRQNHDPRAVLKAGLLAGATLKSELGDASNKGISYVSVAFRNLANGIEVGLLSMEDMAEQALAYSKLSVSSEENFEGTRADRFISVKVKLQ